MAANDPQEPAPVRATTFSLRSIMVIMTMAAAAAVSLAHLFKAANGELKEIGPFVIITAVSPLLLMIVVSWTFKVLAWLQKTPLATETDHWTDRAGPRVRRLRRIAQWIRRA